MTIRRTILFTLLGCLMFVLGVVAAAAQSGAQPFTAPTMQVTVPAGQTLDLLYAARDEEVFTLTAQGGPSADATLEVLNADGVRLAFNDDHGSTNAALAPTDAVISDLLIPRGGALTLRVGVFGGGGGAITLTMISTADAVLMGGGGESDTTASLTGAAGQPSASLTEAAGVLTGGAGVSPPAAGVGGGSLDMATELTEIVPRGGDYVGTITAAAGEIITFTVRALDPSLDPKIEILDLAGAVLAANDDHGTSDDALDQLDSRISNFAFPAAGGYIVRVDGYGNTFGSFELTIDRSGVTGDAPLVLTEPLVVTEGAVQTVTLTVPVEEMLTYPLAVVAGEVYAFTVRALDDETDPFLIIEDENGGLIALNDDQGGFNTGLDFFDVALGNLIVERTGTYNLMIGEYQDAGGTFELVIQRVATDGPLTPIVQEAIRASITPNAIYTHTFTAVAGEYISILADSRTDDLDTRLSLYSEGVLLAENDDHSSELEELDFSDSLIRNFIIPADGTYTIEVAGYQDSAGDFNLLIRRFR